MIVEYVSRDVMSEVSSVRPFHVRGPTRVIANIQSYLKSSDKRERAGSETYFPPYSISKITLKTSCNLRVTLNVM